MYIIRDIFYLKFGHYKEAKDLLDQALAKGMIPERPNSRVLTDFTGDAYRLIFEQGSSSLAEYENGLSGNMGREEWQLWYKEFKEHVERSFREILKQVI